MNINRIQVTEIATVTSLTRCFATFNTSNISYRWQVITIFRFGIAGHRIKIAENVVNNLLYILADSENDKIMYKLPKEYTAKQQQFRIEGGEGRSN